MRGVPHSRNLLPPPLRFMVGSVVQQQGDVGTEMYFVMKGVLVAFRAVPDSDEQVTGFD